MAKKFDPNKLPAKTSRVSTKYNQDVADFICKCIATSTLSTRKLTKKEGVPSLETIYAWLNENKDFASQYARAKAAQAELLIDEIIEISDDESRDLIDTEFGLKPNTAAIQRDKLKADNRKWLASKLLPKKYGNNLTFEKDAESGDSGEKQVFRINGIDIEL